MFKKLLTSFVLASYLFAFFASYAPKVTHAQESVWYFQRPALWYKHVYDKTNPTEIFGERYTAAQTSWVVLSFLTYFPTLLLGPDVISCSLEVIEAAATAAPGGAPPSGIDMGTCVQGFLDTLGLSANLQPTNQGVADNSVKGFLAQVFADKPISGITYTKHALNKLRIIEPTYAQANPQGFGYSTALGGTVQTLWGKARDIAFGLFVLAAIVLSFMIMFRYKTSPQTAVTIQSAIPKLVISLILITFSFAIAGFLIDIMYVVIGLVSLFFGPIIPNAIALGGDVSTTFSFLTSGILGSGVFGFLLFDLFAMPITLWFGFFALAGGAGGWFGETALGAFFGFIGLFVAIIFFVILLIAIFFIWFKISWLLLKTTAIFLMLVMFAPVYLVLGVFVSSLSFSSWIKSLITQLAVFPTVGVLFTLSYLFLAEAFNLAITESIPESLRQYFAGTSTGGIQIGNGWPPLLGAAGDPGSLILLGVSLVFLFMAPKAAEYVKGVTSGRPLGYGAGIGEGIGSSGGVVGGYIGRQAEVAEIEAKFGLGSAADKELAARSASRLRWAQGMVGKFTGGGGRR